MRCRRLLASLALACAGAPALAQGSFDLLQAWQAAEQRDPDYAAAQAARNADQEKVSQARANLLPTIALGATGQSTDTREAAHLPNASSRGVAGWNLTLSQPIFDAAKWGSLRQSEYLANQADVTLQQARQDLALRVAQAYFDVLAAQDTLTTIEAQMQATQTQLSAARTNFELGGTTVADVHEAQSKLDLLKAAELQAHNVLQISRDRLAQIINERPERLAGLVTDLNLPSPEPSRIDDWSRQASQSSLEVASAELNTLIVEKQLDIARSGHYPTLSLQAQTGSSSNRGTAGVNQGPRSLDSSVGLQLAIPLFSGGGISSQVREQTSRLQHARYRLEAARRQSIQASQQAFSQVTSGLAQISALKAAERSSQASLQANQTGYEVGVRINIDVLNAQQQLFETRRALLRARYDTLMASLKLKAASGTLGVADIEAVNQLLGAPKNIQR